MAVRIVRNRDLVRTPWKNGGGTTAEIAVYPPGAGFADFGWRLSMADVATDGPFSIFAGVDRTLALVEGAALALEIDGSAYRLDAVGSFQSFPGEAATVARLPAGPIRDLNVMTRRDKFEHATDRLAPGVAALALRPRDVVAIVAWQDATRIGLDADLHDLDRFDVLLTEAVPSRLSTDRQVLKIFLRPTAPGRAASGGLLDRREPPSAAPIAPKRP